MLYLGNFFLFAPNLCNIKFPYILLNGTAHSIIYSKKSRKIILEKYKKISNIKYLGFECHDIWYNSFLNNRYFYYKPLCFQPFTMTENRKNWSNNFIDFILHFLKVYSEPINGMNNYYIIIYIIYVCIFIIKTPMNFFKNMLSSEGKVSSKRFVTFVCLLFMLIGYTANLFWDFTIDDNLFESLQWIVMAGLGFTAAENFSPKDEVVVEEEPEPSRTVVTHEYDYDEEDI